MSAERAIELFIKLLDIIIEAIGIERAKALMDLDTVRRANAVADAIEYMRFTKLKD